MKTKEWQKAIELIGRDVSHYNYFFLNLRDIAPFKMLKEQGFFSPALSNFKNVHLPIEAMPSWKPAIYLEKLLVRYQQSPDFKWLTEEIIGIIISFNNELKSGKGEHLRKHRVWTQFISLLAKIPGNEIPVSLIRDIKSWLVPLNETGYEIHKICEEILPKFLVTDSVETEKAELLLHLAFSVVPNEAFKESEAFYQERFVSIDPDYWLQTDLMKPEIQEGVAKYCSNKPILYLAKNLKYVLRGRYPKTTVTFTSSTKQDYVLTLTDATGTSCAFNLQKATQEPNKPAKIISFSIKDFEEKDTAQIIKEVIQNIRERGIEINELKEFSRTLGKWLLSLTFDDSKSWMPNTDTIERTRADARTTKVVFTLLLREFVDHKLACKPEAGRQIVIELLSRNFNLPIFRRLCLYFFMKHWNLLKDLFWELIGDKDPLKMFSDNKYEDDLYHLLSGNCENFTEHELAQLNTIISQGLQTDREDLHPDAKDYWTYKWLHSLRCKPSMLSKYQTLKRKFKDDYAPLRSKMSIGPGSISPISKETASAYSVEELVAAMVSFHPSEQPDERRSITGFAEVVKGLVIENPQKYTPHLDQFLPTSRTYFYYIVSAFVEVARKDGSNLAYTKTLQFIQSYLNSSSAIYQADSRGKEIDWDLVYMEIARYISSICPDSHKLPQKALSLAEQIAFSLPTKHNFPDLDNLSSEQLISHLYNSTDGTLQSAILDLALRKARGRNRRLSRDRVKWSKEYKNFFDAAIASNVPSALTGLGYYFRQFCYLDRNWTLDHCSLALNFPDVRWLQFFTGLTSSHAVNDEAIFRQHLKPHYARGLAEKRLPSKENNPWFKSNLVTHLTVYYLWKFEDIHDNDSLLEILLDTGGAGIGSEIIGFIASQEEEILKLENVKQKASYVQRVLSLWRWLYDRYRKRSEPEASSLLSNLATLAGYLEELNEENTQWLVESSKHFQRTFSAYDLNKELVRLSHNGDPRLTAGYIGRIVLSILSVMGPYVHEMYKEETKQLLRFLYRNGQATLSKEIQRIYYDRGIYDFMEINEPAKRKKSRP